MTDHLIRGSFARNGVPTTRRKDGPMKKCRTAAHGPLGDA